MRSIVVSTIASLVVACGGGAPAPQPPVATPSSTPLSAPSVDQQNPARPQHADLLAAEQTAYAAARPVFDKYCASCHTQAGSKAGKKKLDHFDMDTYPFGGHHTATIGDTMREVLGLGDTKPTMPDDQPGLVQGDELAKIAAWTDAWEAADKAGAHGMSMHHADGDHDDDHDHHP